MPHDEATAGDRSFVSDVLLGGALVAFDSSTQDLADVSLNLTSNVYFHGGLLMADGFETGDLTAWSLNVP